MPIETSSLRTLCLSALLLAVASACQSPVYRSFEDVRVGMDKATIVENVGSPAISDRWHGKDRWIYQINDNPHGVLLREIDFENGHAVYVGPKHTASVSAEEQDRVNEAADKADQDNLQVAEDERTQSLGASRPSRSARREPEDALDRKIRESLYGIEPDPERERNKRAPVFVPLQ